MTEVPVATGLPSESVIVPDMVTCCPAVAGSGEAERARFCAPPGCTVTEALPDTPCDVKVTVHVPTCVQFTPRATSPLLVVSVWLGTSVLSVDETCTWVPSATGLPFWSVTVA